MLRISKAVSHLPPYFLRGRSRPSCQTHHGNDARQNSKQYRFLHSTNVRPSSSELDNGSEGKSAEEKGAMSRKLEEMTDQGLEESGYRAQKIVAEAGFSEDLKRRLEAKIQGSEFKSKNPAAFATLEMPVRWPVTSFG